MTKLSLALVLFSCSAPRPLDVFEPFDCESMRDCPGGAQVKLRLSLEEPAENCVRVQVAPGVTSHYLSFGTDARCEDCPAAGETFGCYVFGAGDASQVIVWGPASEPWACDGRRPCDDDGVSLEYSPIEACALSCD